MVVPMDPQYYAFDQSRRRNMLSWKDIKSTGTMLKELVGGLGLSQKDFGNAVKGSFKELSSQRAQGLSYWTSTKNAILSGLGLAASAIEGPYAAAFGIAVDAAGLWSTEEEKTAWKENNPTRIGQWVMIADGDKWLTSHATDIAERAYKSGFGKSLTEGEKAQVKKTISFGFFLGMGVRANTFQVFNFNSGEPEDRYTDKVRVLPTAQQRKLDEDDVLVKLRNIFLERKTTTKLGNDIVCLDPGAEVVYNKKKYHIFDVNGTTARIGDSEKSFQVDVYDLTQGRVTHTNAWNYGAKLTGSFVADGKAQFYKGQWVWVKIRDTLKKTHEVADKELGVIRLINGKLMDGYFAIDGKRFRRTASYLMPLSDVEIQTFNGMSDFVKFKSDAVAGDMSSNPKENDSALGRTYPLITVGLGEFMGGEIHTIHMEEQSGTVEGKQPGFDVEGTPPPENKETRGNAGVKEVLDMARKVGAKSADIQAVEQGINVGRQFRQNQNGTNTTMLFLIGAAIASFFIFRD